MPPPPDALATRLAAARNGTRTAELDALLVTNPVNLRYLTGVAASAGMALVTADGVVVVADQRYLRQFEEAAGDLVQVVVAAVPVGQSYEHTIAVVVGSRQVRTLGSGRPSDGCRLAGSAGGRSGGWELRETSGFIERFRAIKDPWELGRLREAGGRLAEVAACILPEVSEGRTEREVSWKVELALHGAGFERPAFETIVASGPNGARPHHRATDRRIAAGELVVVDFGGVLSLRRGHDPHSPSAECRPTRSNSARRRAQRRQSPPPRHPGAGPLALERQPGRRVHSSGTAWD
jgi:Xaa-Pro aminopeptidase